MRADPTPMSGVEPTPRGTGTGFGEAEVARASEVLKALANPLRLRCMLLCLDRARCVHELVDVTGASQPLVSQHLRVLRTSGLLSVQRRGRETAYACADEHVRHIVLDALEHANREGTFHDHGPVRAVATKPWSTVTTCTTVTATPPR